MQSNNTATQRRRRENGSIAFGAMLLLTSCTDMLRRDDYTVYRPASSSTAHVTPLHEIETVSLADLSVSTPVSVEQATAELPQQDAEDSEPADSIDLALPQARAAALAGNLDLKVELLSPSIAEELIAEEQAFFEPLLFGSASVQRSDNDSTIVDGSPTTRQRNNYEAGLRIPLRTGGSVDVAFTTGKFDDRTTPRQGDEGGPQIIDPVHTGALEVSFRQPLLRGGGVRTSTHAIRVAKYSKDIADARTKLEAIQILANTDYAYWLLDAARRELDVRRRQYELALRQLDEANRRVDAGAAPQIEILRAESGLARRREAIIIADTEVRRRQRDLKRILNRDDLALHTSTAIVPVTEPQPVGLHLDGDALADFAVQNRMELLELELQLAMDASAVDVERNATLPLLTLDSSFSTSGLGYTFNDAVRETGSTSFVDYSFGLTAEFPLGNHRAKARLRRARLQRIQRLATREQRELTIRQEVYDALDQLAQNWQRILAAGQEVALADRTFEAERRQFEVGLRTSTEVLEAAARLADAQSRRIRAIAAYEIAQVNIALATGTLLGKDHVIWEPTRLEP